MHPAHTKHTAHELGADYLAQVSRYLPGLALDSAQVARLYRAGVSPMGAAVWLFCHSVKQGRAHT